MPLSRRCVSRTISGLCNSHAMYQSSRTAIVCIDDAALYRTFLNSLSIAVCVSALQQMCCCCFPDAVLTTCKFRKWCELLSRSGTAPALQMKVSQNYHQLCALRSGCCVLSQTDTQENHPLRIDTLLGVGLPWFCLASCCSTVCSNIPIVIWRYRWPSGVWGLSSCFMRAQACTTNSQCFLAVIGS